MKTLVAQWSSRKSRIVLLEAVALLVVVAAVVLAGPAYADISDQRQTGLLYFLKHDCGSCHGLTRKGGLGSPLLPESVAGRSDEELTEIILDGLPGTPMPPWRALLTEEEAGWLVRAIREGK